MAKLSERIFRWIKSFGTNDQIVLSVLAVLVGAAAGGAAIGFRLAISGFQFLGYGFGGESLATWARYLPWWQVVAVPTLGGLVIGLLVRYLLPDRRPHGVADAIESAALAGGRLPLATGLKASLVSAASIGCGASVGREGPIVHLGASLGAWVAERLHLGRPLSRTLLGCGVAAGVAASFNAPIAGTFFALEVVVGHYALSAFSPVVIAAVCGTIVSRIHYGDYPAFILPEIWHITSFWEFPAFALLGIISAIAATVLLRSIAIARGIARRLPFAPWLHPAAAGLLVGLVALEFPEIMGVGYEATDKALFSTYPLWNLIVLIALKTAATAVCLGAGFGGGIFSPSLFLGAMLGGAYGIIATSVFPELSSGHGAYSLIGMGAVAGATLGAPISTILMIFELTGDYALTVAVMLATVIATLVTRQSYGHSFFTWQLAERGISISGGQDIGLLRSIKTRSVMTGIYSTIGPETPLADLRDRLEEAHWGKLLVVDEEGRLEGIVTFSELHGLAFDTSRDSEVTARDVARRHPTALLAEDDLESAVKVFGATGEAHLPVIADRESRRLIGVAHEHEVFLAYHRALSDAQAG